MLTLLLGVALAAPLELSHSGRALGSDGSPINGAHQLELALYDRDEGTELWSHDYGSVPFEQGGDHQGPSSNHWSWWVR